MIDLGDPVVLTFLVTDAAGAPATGGVVVATVTAPDGTTSTPAVTTPQLGTYSATFTTAQAGRHTVRWTSATNPQAYTDAFNVAPTDPGLIISLAEARLGIGTPTGVTAKDDDLRTAIAAATPVMEDLVGPILARTFDEWHDGGARTVRLNYAPVRSITAVQESYGNFTRTLTAQPLDGATFDAYGYTADLVDGILTRRVSGRESEFIGGRRNIHVTYIAGRTGAISGNILLATRRLVRHLWQQEQQGFRPAFGSAEPMTLTPSGFAVPRVVVELCADSNRGPVVG